MLEKVEDEAPYYDQWFGTPISTGGQTDVLITGEGKFSDFTGMISFNCKSGGRAFWKTASSFGDSVLVDGTLDTSSAGALPSDRAIALARSRFCPAS
ncbi:MAG: hypothetical protein CFE28_03920 [Alphaproteobacteria bacterium PA2]|nr:MAG: hypothetical protein CFE28_03920 [Alphaproteobacteria bacterium PA2]